MKFKKEDIPKMEELLKTDTVAVLASKMDMSHDSLKWHLKHNGVDVSGIKVRHKIETLNALSGKHTLKEMVQITGMARRTIQGYADAGHTVFKFSNKKTVPVNPW